MFKFAHLGDCHIGANRDPVLEKLELAAFRKALDVCVEENVDFVLIAGDLFHANLPDMYAANEAVKKMREVKEAGIPIYVIYGSHDYSPNNTSIIDILDSSGLIKKVVKGEDVGGRLKLEVFVDPKTNAKIVGISGRKAGLEKTFFEMLDREHLEKEPGFKIFAFHSAISELKPDFLAQMESIPVSLLPKGFNYYASGHVHRRTESGFPEHRKIVFPGALFAGYSRDLEDNARGEQRGLYIVSFRDQIEEVKFHQISVCEFTYFEYDVSNRNVTQAKQDLFEKLAEIEAEDKIVVVKIKGELSGGKTSEISSSEIKEALKKNGALEVVINRFGLTSKEYAAIRAMGEDVPTIENRLFKENIGAVEVTVEELKGDKGANLAQNLLRTLRQEQKPNESKKDYTERVQRQAIDTLGLEEETR